MEKEVPAPAKKPKQPNHRSTAATKSIVASMLRTGLKNSEICEILGICEMTLHKHYRKQLVPYAATRKGGAPPHVPTELMRRMVESMAIWARREEIAEVIGIHTSTLAEHYKEELKLAKLRSHDDVMRTLYKRATGGGDWTKASDTANIWYGKVLMGLKEQPVEIANAQGKAFQIEDTTARELIASRIASLAERLRTSESHGGLDGRTVIESSVGLELLGPPRTDNASGRLDIFTGAGRERLGENQNGGGDDPPDGLRDVTPKGD